MALIEVVRAALEAAEWRFDETPDGGACWLWFAGQSCDYRCLVMADEGAEQVGVLLKSPQRVPAARRAAVCEYVVRVNWGLRVGNLDLDLSDGEVRFRAAVDAEGCELPPSVVRMLVNHALWTMDRYHEGLLRVAFGGMAPAKAVAEVREAERREREALERAQDEESEEESDAQQVDIDAIIRELEAERDRGTPGPDAPPRRRRRRDGAS